MSGKNKNKKKFDKRKAKFKRFAEYPYCEMCDKQLILFEQERNQKVPHNAACMLSLWTKLTPELRRHYSRWRMVCRECADKWSHEQQVNIDIAERWQKSGCYPSSMIAGS